MADPRVTSVRVTRVDPNPQGEQLKRPLPGPSFESILRTEVQKNTPLHFSKHAQERVAQRGIELSTTLLQDLKEAVDKARDKGARDVVIIDARAAFIVNIPNNTVITTLSGSEMKNNIFTNIDSAVIL